MFDAYIYRHAALFRDPVLGEDSIRRVADYLALCPIGDPLPDYVRLTVIDYLSRVAALPTPDYEGDPDELTEWQDFDPDC